MLVRSPEAIQRTFEVNTVSHFWTVRAFLPSMIERDHGHIVTISSASAFIGVCYFYDFFLRTPAWFFVCSCWKESSSRIELLTTMIIPYWTCRLRMAIQVLLISLFFVCKLLHH